jgi:hypothetical protein
MKLMYGNVPVKSMNIHSYELSTNDCTAIPSDIQAGVTCVSKGKKITGTGKSFSFASYGRWRTNVSDFIFADINTIQIGCTDYPVKTLIPVSETYSCDFSTPQEVAEVVVDGVPYPMTVSLQNGEFLVSCDKTIKIELFIGKDEYI